MSNDFLEQAMMAPQDAPHLDRAALEAAVNSLKKLHTKEKSSWLASDKMTEACLFLEEHFNGLPPLKLLEDILSYYKSHEHRLEADVLPGLLQRAGLKSVTTAAGDEVVIKEIVSASLGDEEKFSAWAEAHGYADILKYKFSIRKGEDIDAARKALNEQGLNYTEGLDKQGLSQSLGKLARDLIEADQALPPEDAMSVRIFEEARVK